MEWLKKGRNRWIVVAVVAAAVVIGGVFLWRGLAGGLQSEDTRTAVVERGTLNVAVSASGRIEPAAEAGLTFDVPGRVDEVLVELGDAVEEGQPLARLDAVDAELAVQQSEAALAAAEAQLAMLKAGAREQEIAATEAQLRAAQASLSQAAAQRDQTTAGSTEAEIAAAEAQVAAAQTDWLVARQAHDQSMRCTNIVYPDGSKQKICPGLGAVEEQTRYAFHAAEQSLEAAQAQLDALVNSAEDREEAADAAVWAAAAQRDAAQAQLDLLEAGASEEELASAQASVDQARASLEVARNNLEKSTLVAPFDGFISAVNVTAGEAAPTGLPAVSVVDTSHFRITVNVDEIDVASISEGLPVELTVDALPDQRIAGTVARIGPAATR